MKEGRIFGIENLSDPKGFAEQMQSKAQELGLILNGNVIPFFPIPMMLEGKTDQYFREVGIVYRVLRKIEDWLCTDTEARQQLLYPYLSQAEITLVEAATKRRPTTADRRNTRFDTFLTPEGIKIIELNSLCPEGIHYHDALIELGILAHQLTNQKVNSEAYRKRSTARQVLEMMLNEFRERRPGKSISRIGIVYDHDSVSEVNQVELPILAERFSQIAKDYFGLTLEAIVGTVEEVFAKDERMLIGDQEIDVMWRNNLEPALYRELNPAGKKNVPGLIEIITNPDKYIVLNDEAGRIIGNKILFALLHDPNIQQMFSQEEIEVIKRVIPYTAILTEESLSKFLRNNTPFVIKPVVGVHGKNVYFSQNYQNIDELRRSLPQGFFIIQEQVPYPTANLPTITENGIETVSVNWDLNIHHIGGRPQGTCICRASPTRKQLGVLNVAAGGGFLIVM
ncbi:MAG: hypothetical protein QXO21_03590 [Candidatus Anstonellales archaeon]